MVTNMLAASFTKAVLKTVYQQHINGSITEARHIDARSIRVFTEDNYCDKETGITYRTALSNIPCCNLLNICARRHSGSLLPSGLPQQGRLHLFKQTDRPYNAKRKQKQLYPGLTTAIALPRWTEILHSVACDSQKCTCDIDTLRVLAITESL